ncbi:MAG: aldehyde ferredoxin oxidoreductase [Thermoleophilia bacterium]|nr:aldehyde ferredoxin oxidoreductase [Thermoleophilia bacterium]
MRDIRVDMTRGEISSQEVPADSLLGGRAFIDWYLTERVSPGVHPLSEENPFIVATGLLAGTSAPSSGRISVGGKSPLTGGVKEANAGGAAGHKLGRIGVRSIVVTGKAPEWMILRVTAEGAYLEPAGDIVGLDNYAAAEKLRERFGPDVGLMIAGIAGERLHANSTVAVTDLEGRPARHAARGGVGAIMGSKRLKAIVIDDSGGSFRKAADPDGFREAVKAASEALRNDPLCQTVHRFGTPFFIQVEHDRGALVSLNHRAGSFEGVKGINADALVAWTEKHGGVLGHRCLSGCVVGCSNVVHDSQGRYLTASFEFETLTMCGANLGISDLESVARIDRRCDELGLDTIETGATIGLLSDAGIYELGNFSRAMELLEEVAKGTPLGRVVASGTETAAKVFGISRVPTVKGQAIPAHAARTSKGWGVTYATSPQGADHTTGAVTADPLSPHGQVDRSRWSQIINTAMDATGLCHFTFLFRSKELIDLIAPMIATLYGVDFTTRDLIELGKKMLLQEREFNRRAGISDVADRLPEWMRKEPLPPTNEVFDVPQEEIDQFFDFSQTKEFMRT